MALQPGNYRFLGVNDVLHFQIVLPCFAETSTTTLRPGVARAMGYLIDAVPLVEAVAYLVFVVVLYLALVVTLERAPTLDTFTYVLVYWRGWVTDMVALHGLTTAASAGAAPTATVPEAKNKAMSPVVTERRKDDAAFMRGSFVTGDNSPNAEPIFRVRTAQPGRESLADQGDDHIIRTLMTRE